MPWRRTKDPYRILIAEYLLQRTRVVSGTPYYERFLDRFPDVGSLAAAREEEVLRAWEGLGFYLRARNLHAAAKAIVRDHGGHIPSDAATLATLPGIGPYTAGAVASIAFGERVPAVDGNVTRVVARLFRIEDVVSRPAGRAKLQARAGEIVPAERPGPFNQAMMELGATVCLPRRPRCPSCPLGDICLAREAGVQASMPRMPPPRRIETVPVAFVHVRSRGRVLLIRRGGSELLGRLWSLPGGEIPIGARTAVSLRNLVAAQTGLRVSLQGEVARIAHTFSHRRWDGSVFRGSARGRLRDSAEVRWVTLDEARRLPLVSFQRRIIEELEARRPLESFGRTVSKTKFARNP